MKNSNKKNKKEFNQKNILIEAVNIAKDYRFGGNFITLLKDLDLIIREGDLLSIVGISGSGKTSLLNLLTGIEFPDDGDIFYKEEDFEEMADKKRLQIRREKFGIIFEKNSLLNNLTIKENFEFAQTLSAKKDLDKNFINELVKLLDLENKLNLEINKLSTFEYIKTSLAKSLINDPEIIFMDNPTKILNQKEAIEFVEIIKDLAKKYNEKAFILFTDNLWLATNFGKMKRLEGGKLA